MPNGHNDAYWYGIVKNIKIWCANVYYYCHYYGSSNQKIKLIIEMFVWPLGNIIVGCFKCKKY